MIEWKIQWLQVSSVPVSGYEKVVSIVGWACVATDDASKSTTIGGRAMLPNPNEDFTPFDDLSEAKVLGWVWDTVNKAAVESSAIVRLTNQLTTIVEDKALPWRKDDLYSFTQDKPAELDVSGVRTTD